MSLGRKKPVPDGKIEKPEDRAWKEEFEAMTVEDHKKALHQLGLDEEDIEEWEEAVGYREKKAEQMEESQGEEKQEKAAKQVKKQK